METKTRIESGSPYAVQSSGPAGTVSDSEQIKQCPHPFNGCISEIRGKCMLGGPCDPCDSEGRRFRLVSVITADGFTIWGRDFLPEPDAVIDSDAANEALVMVKRLQSRQARS